MKPTIRVRPVIAKVETKSVASPEEKMQWQELDNTDAHGLVDHDALVQKRLESGVYPPTQTSERKAMFMLGGTGSGKDGVIRGYVGSPGDEASGKAPIAPRPGFSADRVYGADSEKKGVPIYTPQATKDGRYGPSGPKTIDELRAYPPDQQDAVNDYIKRASGGAFKNAAHFAREVMPQHNEGGTIGENFGGGLTHELGSHFAKEKAREALADPAHGSFIYNSTGSEDYPEWAKEAIDNGYAVDFHHVDAPVEVGQMRNAERGRAVDPAVVEGTHAKVEHLLPKLRGFQKAAQEKGDGISWTHTRTSNDHDLARAMEKGYGRHGKA